MEMTTVEALGAGISGIQILIVVAVVLAITGSSLYGLIKRGYLSPPRKPTLAFGILCVSVIATIAVFVDWGSHLHVTADEEDPFPFYWAESVLVSATLSAIAVLVSFGLRNRPTVIPVALIAVLYLLTAMLFYQFAFTLLDGDWYSALTEIVSALFNLQHYEGVFGFYWTYPFYLLHGVAIVGACYPLHRLIRQTKPAPTKTMELGVHPMHWPSDQTTRLLLGSAVLKGSLFRRRVIQHVEQDHLASPPHLSTDVDLIGRVCESLERHETGYQIAYLGLGLATLIVLSAPGAETLGIVTVLATIAAHLRKESKYRFQYAVGLMEKSSNPGASLIQSLGVKASPAAGFENFAEIYRNFDPFESFGSSVANLTISVDLNRPKDGLPEGVRPREVEVEDLYDALQSTMSKSSIPNMEKFDRLFIRGDDIPATLLRSRYGPPRQDLSPEEIRELAANPDVQARRYKVFAVKDWGGEIEIFFFVNCIVQGQTLFVEVSGRLLPPLAEPFRKIDTIPPRNSRTTVRWFFETVAWSPFKVSGGLLILGLKAIEAIAVLIGHTARVRRREIDDTPRYNFGAPTALRKDCAGSVFTHYFQKQDQTHYVGTFNQNLFNAIVDFLDEHNIDTSALKDRQAMILNSGILVQGGNVHAGNLAVGQGARASLVNKLKPQKQS